MSAERRPLGIALSGGGARAALASVGVLRFLADADRLGDVRHLTAVSGGSITAGLVACRWDDLRQGDFSTQAFDTHVTQPLLDALSARSIQRELLTRLWQTVLPRTSRTHLLAKRLDAALFDGTLLRDLPRGTWFEINAANLTTGTRFRFTQDLIGDYITGSTPTSVLETSVADAVAWSCAVPGAFNTTLLPGLDLPCQDNAGVPELVDGSVYDNLGVDAFKRREEMPGLYCIVCNAGGIFEPGEGLRKAPLIGALLRSNSVLYNQVASVRSRQLFQEFTATTDDTLDGCLFNLRSQPPQAAANDHGPLARFLAANEPQPAEAIAALASYPTTLHQVPSDIAHRLVRHGWWLAGATLSAHAPDLLDATPTYAAPSETR